MSAPHMPAKMCQLDNLYITVLSHIIKVYETVVQVENQSFEFDCILKVLFISKSLMMSAPHMPAKMCQLDNLYITVLSHIIKVYKSDI